MSSTQTPTSPSSSSSLPKLGPAWYRAAGGNKGGFRPPPAVPLDNNKQQQQQQQRPSSGGNVNSFSALLLEDEDEEPTTTTTAPPARAAPTMTTELPRPLFQRNPSSGGGRSLAELAAAAAPTSATSSSRATRSSSTAITEGSFRKSVDDQPIVRYTREKLLAMRPSCSSSLPSLLEPLQGNVILANHALDPVSFDEFDADDIWGAATSSGSRNNTTTITSSSISGGANVIRTSSGTLVATNAPNKSSSTVVSSEGGNKGGRWERGVALPPPEEHRTTSSNNNSKGGLLLADDDLWDDPITTTDATNTNNPASDFSSFGMPMADIMMDGGGTNNKTNNKKQDTLLDLSTLSEAALKLDQEIHPSSGTSNVIPKSSNLLDHRKEVNPTRPLASAGTTIRSGSGENVNVFEDFDDETAAFEDEEPPSADELVFVGDKDAAPSLIEEEAEETEEEVPAVISSSEPEEEETPIPIPEAAAETSASSRLMQMIGMDSTATSTIIDSPSPWGLELKPSFNLVPRNPWGEPGGASHEAEWKALQEAELQRQRQVEEQLLEEQKRMARIRLQQQQQEEEERKRAAEVAARKAGAPQQQQPSQVEMVLIERISTVLENSWGKSDLVTILTALHRDDPRVIPLLPNQDALRALLLRHPNRIQMGRDPAYGVDIAALTLTNAQFVVLQQQQEQQQQQEIQRQQQQLLLAQQQQQRQQAEAQARAVFQQQQQQQQQHQRPTVSTNAPWYYADPQGNIQGPFGGDEMRQWLDGGYFKEDLPISQSPQGPFRALSLYFPDWHVAFVSAAADEKKLAEEQAAQRQEQKERFERERALEFDRLEREQRASVQQAQRKEVDHHPPRMDRANEKTRSKESANNVVGDQNASSVQLKMLLGLGGKQQQEENTVDNDRSNSNGGAVRINKKTSPKHYPQPSSDETDFSSSVAAATVQPVVAWGGASQQALVRKKSMSEIQQEEARVAARLSKEREANSLTRTNSGGWANVAAAGTSAWSSTTASTTTRPAPPVVVGAAGASVPNAAAKPIVPVAASMQQVRVKQQAQVVAAQKQALAQKKRDGSNSAPGDEFGAKMSPSLENWCKEQLRKITGSDDLTLVSFCTTLKDDAEIHQYLVAYLGSTPQVNSFASEFISRKNGGKRQVEEWETTGKAKARKGKKTAATGSK